MEVIIYHNPRCSKSRQALELLRENGIEPQIVEYLKNPLSVAELEALIGLLGMKPRQLLRKGEDAYKENNLADEGLSDDKIIQAMAKNAVLIERPIVVVSRKKAVIGRPIENILAAIGR